MAKALQNFEVYALQFDPRVLLLGGILVLIAGLCVWLGGLRWAGPIAAVIGGLTGLICAYAFSNRAAPEMIITPVIGTGLGAFLKKPIIILCGAGGLAAATWLVLAAPNLEKAGSGPSHAAPRSGSTLNPVETASALSEELVFWGETFAGALKQMSPAAWATGAAAAALAVGASLVMPRLVTAAACAGMGAACVFAGMIVLLLYKGARPLTSVYARPTFFGLVAMVMIVFGTLSQLLLCPEPQVKAEHKGGKKK